MKKQTTCSSQCKQYNHSILATLQLELSIEQQIQSNQQDKSKLQQLKQTIQVLQRQIQSLERKNNRLTIKIAKKIH